MGGGPEDTRQTWTETHYCKFSNIINEELHRQVKQQPEFRGTVKTGDGRERKSCEEQVSRELVSVVHYRDRNTNIVAAVFLVASTMYRPVDIQDNLQFLMKNNFNISESLVNICSSFCSEI